MESQIKIIILVLVTFITVLLPSAIIIFTARLSKRRVIEKEAEIMQRELEALKMVMEAESKEREKIAGYLHDNVIPNFCAIQSSLETNLPPVNDNYFKAKFTLDMKAFNKGIGELRNITHELAPPTLSKHGLLMALEEHCDILNDGINHKVLFSGDAVNENDLLFSISEKANIYSVCLELLQNLNKYASYKTLRFNAELTPEALVLEMTHNGTLISNQQIEVLTANAKGIGLKSIQSRCLVLNANVNYSSHDGIGFISFSIPFKRSIQINK